MCAQKGGPKPSNTESRTRGAGAYWQCVSGRGLPTCTRALKTQWHPLDRITTRAHAPTIPYSWAALPPASYEIVDQKARIRLQPGPGPPSLRQPLEGTMPRCCTSPSQRPKPRVPEARTSAATKGAPAIAPAGDAGYAPGLPSLPAPRSVGHAQWSRGMVWGGGVSFKAGTAELTSPAGAPPGWEV